MTIAQWDAATRPKIEGTRNLHELLPGSMDFFVMFSSVSGICGQRGQANYAAANTYLDAMAHYRVSRGEKAVAINLGAIVSDGYLAENQEVRDRLLAAGSMLPITREDVFALLEYYCDPELPILSPPHCQIVIGINNPQNIMLQGQDLPSFMRQPMFSIMQHMPGAGTEASADGSSVKDARNFQAEFLKALSPTDASVVAATAIVAKLARALSSVQEEDVDVHKPIHTLGVDSLLAVELRSWIAREFQADVPIFELLSGNSFATVGVIIAKKSRLRRDD